MMCSNQTKLVAFIATIIEIFLYVCLGVISLDLIARLQGICYTKRDVLHTMALDFREKVRENRNEKKASSDEFEISKFQICFSALFVTIYCKDVVVFFLCFFANLY